MPSGLNLPEITDLKLCMYLSCTTTRLHIFRDETTPNCKVKMSVLFDNFRGMARKIYSFYERWLGNR